MLTTCTQCGGTNSSHAKACFVCDAPLRRYTPADEPEPDDAAKFEADLMGSLPEPVRKASERAAATIAAIRNSASPAVVEPPAAEPPAAERKPAPRPRRADTRIYPGPAPEPAETTPAVSPRSESGTIVAGPHPPRRTPRTRVTPIPSPSVGVAVAEPEAAPAPLTESSSVSARIASEPQVTLAEEPEKQMTSVEIKKPLAAADLSDPESSDKLSIASGILSTATAPEPRLTSVVEERIATPAEISSLKTEAPAAKPEPPPERKIAPVRVMPISASTEPQWRQELSTRVEAYRARRRNIENADSAEPQDSLPFSEPAIVSDAMQTEAEDAPDPRASLRLHARSRPPQTEKIEISAEQPALDFVAAEQMRPFAERLVPVAAVDERRAAGLLDAGFLLLSYAGFLALFGSLGGKFSFGKLDLLVYGVTFFLFYVQYFALFTALGGATPGMGKRGLRVVAFDGSPASARQLVWRSFGYVISAATMMLGFLWALWDEDQLTWHDRMSQTYLTSVPHATITESDMQN